MGLWIYFCQCRDLTQCSGADALIPGSRFTLHVREFGFFLRIRIGMMPLYRDYCVPRLIDRGCGRTVFAQQRSSIVAHATGRVLEVGFGSGRNLAYYDPSKVPPIWR